jgi:hypothetical protein
MMPHSNGARSNGEGNPLISRRVLPVGPLIIDQPVGQGEPSRLTRARDPGGAVFAPGAANSTPDTVVYLDAPNFDANQTSRGAGAWGAG